MVCLSRRTDLSLFISPNGSSVSFLALQLFHYFCPNLLLYYNIIKLIQPFSAQKYFCTLFHQFYLSFPFYVLTISIFPKAKGSYTTERFSIYGKEIVTRVVFQFILLCWNICYENIAYHF